MKSIHIFAPVSQNVLIQSALFCHRKFKKFRGKRKKTKQNKNFIGISESEIFFRTISDNNCILISYLFSTNKTNVLSYFFYSTVYFYGLGLVLNKWVVKKLIAVGLRENGSMCCKGSHSKKSCVRAYYGDSCLGWLQIMMYLCTALILTEINISIDVWLTKWTRENVI